jgi:hypothetical protein
MIRNSHSEFFKWLPIGRICCQTGSGTRRPGGVMEFIKGNIGAIPDFTGAVVFSPQPRGSKDVANGSVDGRMIYPNGSAPFTSMPLPTISATEISLQLE